MEVRQPLGGIYTAYVKQLGRGKIRRSEIGDNSGSAPAFAKQVWGVKFKFHHGLVEPLAFHLLRLFAPLLLRAVSGSLS